MDLALEAIPAPNPYPNGVVPFVKGAHFDQAGHVTGTMRDLRGERIRVDCYSVRGLLVGTAAARTAEAQKVRRRGADQGASPRGRVVRRRGLFFVLCRRAG